MDQGNTDATLIVFPYVVFLWPFTFKRAKRLFLMTEIFMEYNICFRNALNK